MIKYNTPQELFTAICDKIRDKTNSNELINHQDIPDKIDNLVSSGIINEYNELLSMINQNTIIELNNNEIENINICFIGCTSLTTIDLPKCATIGWGVFQNCASLTTINLPECTSIREYGFSCCTSLTTVNLPECTSIGNSAFNSCASLTTIDLPKCTSIGGAFSYCASLTTIDLPKCTSIRNYAFQNCTSLATIILSSNQMVTLKNTNAFYNTPIANGTGYIYVPDNLVDSYKTATNWSTYANQIKPISELPSNLKEEYNL